MWSCGESNPSPESFRFPSYDHVGTWATTRRVLESRREDYSIWFWCHLLLPGCDRPALTAYAAAANATLSLAIKVLSIDLGEPYSLTGHPGSFYLPVETNFSPLLLPIHLAHTRQFLCHQTLSCNRVHDYQRSPLLFPSACGTSSFVGCGREHTCGLVLDHMLRSQPQSISASLHSYKIIQFPLTSFCLLVGREGLEPPAFPLSRIYSPLPSPSLATYPLMSRSRTSSSLLSVCQGSNLRLPRLLLSSALISLRFVLGRSETWGFRPCDPNRT